MKIALISHLFPTELHPFSGKFIKDQLTMLNSEPGIEADLIVPTPFSIPFTKRKRKNHSDLLVNCEANRLRYLSFPRKRFPTLISASLSKAVGNYFKNQTYDVINVHWIYPDALCIPELKQLGFKTVLTVHGSDWYQSKNNRTLSKLFGEVLHHVDRVLYSGPKLKEDMESHFPFLSRKSEIVYNMVDEHLYDVPAVEEKDSAKKELNWDTEKTHSLTVANIRHEKGIDLLLKSINEEMGLKNTHFHIIGAAGPESYMTEIHSLLKANSFDNITIHQPVLPGQLIKYYHAADFFTQPSRREGFSVAILEAMACGLPVICTDVGGNRFLIDDQTGLLIKNGTSGKLSDELRKMAEQYKSYDRNVIHSKVTSKYGREAFKKRLLDNFTEVLAD
ncbi:glycosyltransferase family 4 protein [Gracilimonas sediminicola]|uniref:Glycosyltransferase family 4 protein n=1 Tax=Gracilimonas sediminicola TaxID=2952158 RepID=A0A9X2L3G0_9BACT|nr:glycosyltransferase family 4 protein [Gracilimonas sediminicola]MCP9291594.1 glycosyltransferase family 4 protein [Gracilimonas sediminicola]